MMFWNRIEVYCGFAMKDFSELRDILELNEIKYDYVIKGKKAIQYYLYVHKKDYDNALFLMHTARKQ